MRAEFTRTNEAFTVREITFHGASVDSHKDLPFIIKEGETYYQLELREQQLPRYHQIPPPHNGAVAVMVTTKEARIDF